MSFLTVPKWWILLKKKLTRIFSLEFLKFKMNSPFQQMVLKQLDIHIQKNGLYLTPYTNEISLASLGFMNCF